MTRAVRTRSRARKVAAFGVVLTVLAALAIPVSGSTAAGAATNSNGTFNASKTITRENLDANGVATVVDSRLFTLTVSQTQDIRNLQDVDVSWTGAHPTGGIEQDYNSAAADDAEYPVAILECRGSEPGDPGYVAGSPTVSPQTCWTHGNEERYQGISYTDFAPWRLDAYATAADRDPVVGRPDPVPAACATSLANNEYWVPFIAADGTAYDYGNSDCAGIPPDDFELDTAESVIPPNATFASTNTDGTGSVRFDIQTDEENASLGCSATVACTLEVIPIMGLSCDPFGVSPAAPGLPADDIPTAGSDETKAAAGCEAGASSFYPPGSLHTNEPQNLAVSGELWWAASNWRNRVSVPLTFAPESNACSLVGAGQPVLVYGSELMEQATQQWAPTFCSSPKLFNLTHVATSEPLAESLVNTGGVQAAFSSESPPGGFQAPVDQAPVAVTGFSISYTIDDANGQTVTNLKLDARLLAKLLTESYTELDFDIYKTGQYPYLAHNPVNITQDPEFIALNPGITRTAGTSIEDALTAGASTLIMLDGNSDVTYALTSYIESDPEARAWLAGTPDPWGMVVNKNYNTTLNPNFSLPVYQWPLLDQTIPDFDGQSICEEQDPSPWLPNVASPVATLALSTLAVQFASPTSKVACTSTDTNAADLSAYEYVASGRQQPGARFVIGVTSLGEAERYDLNSASLETSSTPPSLGNGGSDFQEPFTDASNRTFVAPTNASLKAAGSMLVADPSSNTWTVPYQSMSSNPAAYPGIMIVNADVPTSGLTAPIANDYANLLRYAAGPGQDAGLSDGQLPPGYLPMTSANGFGPEVAYTLRAATDIAKQTGQVTQIVPAPAAAAAAPVAPVNLPSLAPLTSASSSAAAHASAAPTNESASLAAGKPQHTLGLGSGIGGLALPILLAIAALGALASAGSYLRPRSIFGAHPISRMRSLPGRRHSIAASTRAVVGRTRSIRGRK